jgi:chromodomain-helicase-DNA-binding protein 7
VFCKEVIPDGQIVDSLVLENPKWSSEDQSAAIAYLLRFGVERDEDGDPDYYLFMKGSGLGHRTEDDVRKFIEELLYKCDHPETARPVISYKTAILVAQRVAQMSNLRQLLEHDDLHAFLSSAPKWRNLPKQWTPDHEIKFFRCLLRVGFGSLAEILREPIFAEFFRQMEPPSALLSDDAVMKRISILDDIRRHPKSRSKRGRREKEEPKEASQIMNWDEIWNGGDVRFPIEVRANCYLWDLGHVVSDRPHFHTERYIYPAGYRTTRSFWSTQHANDRVIWVSEIVDTGGPKPVFRVYIEDNPRVCFEGATTSQPWVLILKAVAAKRREKKSNTISGPMAYCLDRPIVQRLIQELPGARQCKNYAWVDFTD